MFLWKACVFHTFYKHNGQLQQIIILFYENELYLRRIEQLFYRHEWQTDKKQPNINGDLNKFP